MTKTFPLSALLAGEAFPFEFTFPEDSPYAGFSFRYKELPTDVVPALAEAVKDDLDALGIDPLAAVMTEIAPQQADLKGEEYIRFHERLDALTIAQTVTYRTAMARVTGKLLSLIIGEWNGDVPVTAETCAALPPSVQRTILTKASEVTLGDDAKKN